MRRTTHHARRTVVENHVDERGIATATKVRVRTDGETERLRRLVLELDPGRLWTVNRGTLGREVNVRVPTAAEALAMTDPRYR